MDEFDLGKSLDELIQPTEPPKEVALAEAEPPNSTTLANTTEATTGAPNSILLETILARLSPEGQAWLNSLNRFCRRAIEYDLRAAGPDLFVRHWESLRDRLQKLERDFGPSDNWM